MMTKFSVMPLLIKNLNISVTGNKFWPSITFFLCFHFVCLCMKARHGYRNLTGIDYSPTSVELARNVFQAEDLMGITLKVSSVIFKSSLNLSNCFAVNLH